MAIGVAALIGDPASGKDRLVMAINLNRTAYEHAKQLIRDGRYVMQGDNNSWTDPEAPTDAQLVGRRVLAVHGLGHLFRPLDQPVVAAALIALLGFAAAGGAGSGRPRRQPGRMRPPRDPGKQPSVRRSPPTEPDRNDEVSS